MNQVLYYIIFTLSYLASLLPWWFLYAISDYLLYPVVYHLVGYRRKVVRKNLTESFPQKNLEEIEQIERGFYHWFCDLFVQIVKQVSMSKEEIVKHMEIVGAPEAQKAFQESGASLMAVYLGHFGNWEWATAMGAVFSPENKCCHIYHPLENESFDRLMLRNRSICGSTSLAMGQSLRAVIEAKRRGEGLIMGFISDQIPLPNAVHHWMQWLNHDTGIFTGGETMGRKVGGSYWYLDVEPVKRGYYRGTLRPLEPVDGSPYPYTEAYMRAMEASIIAHPEIYLWSHNRWKRPRK